MRYYMIQFLMPLLEIFHFILTHLPNPQHLFLKFIFSFFLSSNTLNFSPFLQGILMHDKAKLTVPLNEDGWLTDTNDTISKH